MLALPTHLRAVAVATTIAAVGLALASAPIALAGDPPPAHGQVLGAGHGAPAHAQDPHGADPLGAEEHLSEEHHTDYIADHDADGVPSWRDPRIGDEPNPDYMVVKLLQHGFNLLLLLAVIAYLARRPLGDALRNRATSIRRDITEAAKLRDEAVQRHAEIEARLSNFEAEVAGMRARTAADAKAEEERLVERAHAEAERIRELAGRNIRDEVTRAQLALRAEAVELAVKLAEQTLRANVESEDQRRLARQFLDSLNANGVNGHG